MLEKEGVWGGGGSKGKEETRGPDSLHPSRWFSKHALRPCARHQMLQSGREGWERNVHTEYGDKVELPFPSTSRIFSSFRHVFEFTGHFISLNKILGRWGGHSQHLKSQLKDLPQPFP